MHIIENKFKWVKYACAIVKTLIEEKRVGLYVIENKFKWWVKFAYYRKQFKLLNYAYDIKRNGKFSDILKWLDFLLNFREAIPDIVVICVCGTV